jgi:hypothetical protein
MFGELFYCMRQLTGYAVLMSRKVRQFYVNRSLKYPNSF